MASKIEKPAEEAAPAAKESSRPRGRPKLTIDRDAVADAVAELFDEGGDDAVSIINTADKLSVSRATLYRTVPTKEDLLGILFERSTAELTARALEAIDSTDDPRSQLTKLIELQANAAVQMRAYMPVFFGSSHLPSDVVGRWHRWSRKFETIWVDVIDANMRAGNLEHSDPRIAARLMLGMLIWVSRWFRPRENVTAGEIAEVATRLLGLAEPAAARSSNNSRSTTRRLSAK